jgi:hypothetical protein
MDASAMTAIFALNTPEERLSHLARLIVVARLRLRETVGNAIAPYYPMRPDESDFLQPFRILLRIELLMVRIDQAEKDGCEEAAAEYRKEILNAEVEFIKLTL